MLAADPLDMRLVEHGFIPGDRRCGIVAPVEAFVYNGSGEAVRGIVVRRPGKPADHFTRVGIEQQAVRVEAVSLFRRMWPMYAIGVAHSRAGAGEVAMPHLIAAFAQGQHAHPHAVKKAQLDCFGVRREKREVDSVAVPTGAEWPGPPGLETDAVDHVAHSK